MFGAVRVDNRQFLLLYQKARKCITKNISGAWTKAGLIPFQPDKILNRFKPKTPPFVSSTDNQGRHINVQIPDQITKRINKLVDNMATIYATPLRQEIIFFKNTTLTALTNYRSLELFNDKLIKKQRKNRVKKNNKAFTGAKILCMSDIIKQAEERREKEQKEEKEKARKKALKGVIGFAKQV